MASICGSVDGGKEGSNLLLSGSAVLLDLGDGAVHGGDGLLGCLLLLSHVDGVVDDLVLKGIGHFIQGNEVVLGMLVHHALGTNRLVAGLAVGIDLESDVLLAAGNALGGGGSSKGVIKGDLLVIGSNFHFPVTR